MDGRNIEGRVTVEDVGRLYRVSDQWLPSVSTVLGMRETPEALKRWKQRTENKEEIMSYKQNRGTLIHEACLDQIAPRGPDGEKLKVIWSEDEMQSAQELWHGGNYMRYYEDENWAMKTWDIIKAVSNFDTVIDIETYVANTDIGYAGQFDLLYQDGENGDTVLADLKTSKYCYEKHLLQLVAYKRAVPLAIDRMEVIRLNPDQKDWTIFPDTQWDANEEDLWTEFCRLRGELEQQHLHTIIDTIEDSTSDDAGVLYEDV